MARATFSLCGPWRLEHSCLVGDDGRRVSQPGFDAGGWHDALVPTTVLRALVRDGTYPDPRFGLNSFRIPDSSDEFNARHGLARFSHLPDGRNPWRDPWWYRAEFDLPARADDETVWLTLNCLNYRAEIWVNGARVAGRDQVVGMFRRFRLDITAQAVSGRNALAILVCPVDHPGVPDAQLEVFGKVRGFHKEICNDVTEVMTVGYDCFPTVPDRNLGLIQEVSVEITGPVDVRAPFVRCEVPLPSLSPARLTVSAELVNLSSRPLSGELVGVVTPPGGGDPVAAFRRPVTLFAHETQTVTVSPTDAPSLALAAPALWWPNTYGAQPLYGLRLEFLIGGRLSSRADVPFGVRRIDRELHARDGAHGFRLLVNGERIFLRGGYIQPEMMFDWDPDRVDTELRYLGAANLNYVVFEDIPNPPDWFLDLCDRHGILFWNCFYGCYWLQYNRPWDIDRHVLEDCTADLVRHYRNHPSLVLYMAQNEGETREDVYAMWRRTVLALDPTRFLMPSGSFPDYRTEVPAWFRPDLPAGMNDYPPKSYGWQLPQVYFRFVREQPNWMFMIESCSASVPPWESLTRFLPGLRDLPPNPGTDPQYPLDAAWAHFGANSYYTWFDRGLRLLYGEPTDAQDYVWKAHLVTYDQHRALFEAVHHRLWDVTSGFGEWKLNSAFPDIQWQVHDWFLRPMVSLYAIRKACAELAVLLCPLDGVVSVVNNRFSPVAGLCVEAAVHDLDMRVLHRQSASADVPANAAREVFCIPRPSSVAEAPVYFVRLEVRDAAGARLADNFYWLSPRLDDVEVLHTGDLRRLPADKPLLVPRQTPCFPELSALPRVPVTAAVERVSECALRVRVANPGARLAFFVRLRVVDAGGDEILPVFWSDNYISLLPGESRDLAAAFKRPLPGSVRVAADGWNVVPGTAPVA